MKLTKYIASLLSCTLLFSCNNFEDINTNPDAINRGTPALLATGAIMGIMKPNTGKSFTSNQLTTKHLCWSEAIEGAQYNNFGREGFSGYTSLKDYKLMATQAEAANLATKQKNAYKGLALFLKAYRLFDYTLNVGDIPYEGILEGAEGHLTVAYNTQKEVLMFLLNDLDQAHEYFQQAKGDTFEGDPIFKGDVTKWNKQVNALELRILINLSKKEADTDLKVATKFNEVVARGQLMSSNSDNLQLVFSDIAGQLYPFHKSKNSHYEYPMLSITVVDFLKANKDYRLFYYAEPSAAKIKAGLKENEWEAYLGTDPSMPHIDIAKLSDAGEYCPLNTRYSTYAPGEPYVRIGYAEQNFILAEAALRGWIEGDASAYYKKAIEASMRFTADNTPDKYNHGCKITDEVIAAALTNPTIQLSGDFDADLKKIIQQKYVAGFMQLPYQTYYDYRRTGHPEFPINPETNQNSYAPDKMPIRWMYPSGEFDYNRKNVDAAVQRQFGGSDDVNQLMWILQ